MAKKEPALFILLLFASFASVAAVLFTPALPEITLQFQVSNATAQLSMTLFLIGYAFGNLPWGPISNRFGRKPAVFAGSLLAILGSLLILGSGNVFGLFLLGRFLMALGSSVGIKIAFTMIGDVYSHELATKKISYMMFAFAIAPGLAVALGGYLTQTFGWQSCFYFLAVYSAAIFVLTFFLPETCPQIDRQACKLENIQAGYLQKLKNTKLITASLLMGCVTSIVYLFASEAPFIGIEHVGLTPEQYGLFNFIPPIGLIAGSLYSNMLAGKQASMSVIKRGIWICLTVSLIMFLLFAFGWVTAWALFLPMPFMYIGTALLFSNASAFAMSHAKNKSNASAMMNFINMAVSVVAVLAIEMLPSHPVYCLPLFFLVISGAMFLLRRRLVLLSA